MKIEEQVLSREQMAHLVELGVDTSNASMCWAGNDVVPNNGAAFDLGYDGIPTYTIGDLIEKLPKRNDEGSYFNIKLGDKTLSCAYTDVFVYYAEYNNLIDGLYNYLCWVAKYHKELIK